MVTFVEITTPNNDQAPDSAPRRIVSEFPTIEIEVVQFKQQANTAIPYFWVEGIGANQIEEAVKNDPRLSKLQQLDQSDGRILYKVRWNVDSPLISCSLAANGLVMQAHGIPDEWQIKLWFETGKGASAFQNCCQKRDVPLVVNKVASVDEMTADDPADLSQSQSEIIRLAYNMGYFEVPRSVSQDELAEKLGISSSAVGDRLRRGLANLVEDTLIE